MKKVIFLFVTLSNLICISGFSQNYSEFKTVSITQPASPERPPELVLKDSSILFLDENQNNGIDPGEKGKILMTFMNTGSGRAAGIKLQVKKIGSSSGISIKDNIDIGSLMPEKETEVTIPFESNLDIENGNLKLEIIAKELYGFDADPVIIDIPTNQFLKPKLEIKDYVFSSPLQSQVKPGTPILLNMIIKNSGEGPASLLNVSLNLPNQVFPMGDTSFSYNSILPNQEINVEFGFFTSKNFNSPELPLTIDINEKYKKFGIQRRINVPLGKRLPKPVVYSISNLQSNITAENTISNLPVKKSITLVSDISQNIPKSDLINQNGVAIVIGNQVYTHPDIPSVDYANNDAFLVKKYLVETFGFQEGNILFLENATQGQLNSTFGSNENFKGKLFNMVQGGKSDIFIYYSGHGAPSELTEEGYLVPSDCEPTLIDLNGYSLNTLFKNLSFISYNSLTVVIDACFSGNSPKGTLIKNASPIAIRPKLRLFNNENTLIITSATGEQIASWYPEQNHSLFTYYFLKGIQGEANKNQDDVLKTAELKSYIDQNVPYMGRYLNNREQHPQLFGDTEKIFVNY